MLILFSFAANVHFLRAKLQVYFSQCASHDQLHAENFDRDVLLGYTGLLSTCLHLHSTAGHSPQKCHDHEEKGLFTAAVLTDIDYFKIVRKNHGISTKRTWNFSYTEWGQWTELVTANLREISLFAVEIKSLPTCKTIKQWGCTYAPSVKTEQMLF